MDLNDAHAEAGNPLNGAFFDNSEKEKWERILKREKNKKMNAEANAFELKRQIWAEGVLANINAHVAWNEWLGKTESELADVHDGHLERKYGIVSKCFGAVDGLCFDIRTSECITGREIIHNKCKGGAYIQCCPGAEIEDDKKYVESGG